MENNIRVLSYEVGYDVSEILGSGTTYHAKWTGKSEAEALAEFQKPSNTYLSRLVRDENGRLKTQFYDRYASVGNNKWLY